MAAGLASLLSGHKFLANILSRPAIRAAAVACFPIGWLRINEDLEELIAVG